MCRSSILELFIIEKYSLREAQNRIAILIFLANSIMISIQLYQKINFQNISLSVFALNILIYFDYHRYMSIYKNEKVLILQDVTWLTAIICLLILSLGSYNYATFILHFYICGSIIALAIKSLYSLFNRNKFKSTKDSSELVQVDSTKSLYKTLVYSNLILYIVNLTILAFVQNSYATTMLLEIRKIVWITSPVTTFTLIIWTFLITNHKKSKLGGRGIIWHLKSVFGLFCLNLIITTLFYTLFLKSGLELDLLLSTLIFLFTITIGQLALPHVLKFRKLNSNYGIYISSVFGPLLTLTILILLGESISVIQYNLVILICTSVAWILILKESRKLPLVEIENERSL